MRSSVNIASAYDRYPGWPVVACTRLCLPDPISIIYVIICGIWMYVIWSF